VGDFSNVHRCRVGLTAWVSVSWVAVNIIILELASDISNTGSKIFTPKGWVIDFPMQQNSLGDGRFSESACPPLQFLFGLLDQCPLCIRPRPAGEIMSMGHSLHRTQCRRVDVTSLSPLSYLTPLSIHLTPLSIHLSHRSRYLSCYP
jgi:hypothetical protein